MGFPKPKEEDVRLFITFSAACRSLGFELMWPIAVFVLDILNLMALFEEGHHYWFGLTLALSMMPGTLEAIYWLMEICKRFSRYTKRESALWMIWFGPLTFPFAVWIYHAKRFVLDFRNRHFVLQKEFSESNVFKCLQAFTEQAPEMLLQLFIIIVLWNPEEEFHLSIKLGVLFLKMVSVSQTSVDHHLRELSAKTSLPRLCDTLRGSVFFLFHLLVRTVTLAVIAAYCRWALFTAISVIILLNLCYVHFGLASTVNKAVFTVSASVLVPICFMASITAKSFGLAKCSRRFCYYYLWNTIVFTVVSATALIGIIALLANGDLTYNCDDMPVFSCAPGCPGRDAFCFFNVGNSTSPGEYATHGEFAAILVPLLIGLNLMCIFSVWLMGKGNVLMKY